MYKYIFDPLTKNQVEILSARGKILLENYINSYLKIQDGGEFIASGAYKCVFRPALQIVRGGVSIGESMGENYISTVMVKEEAIKEINEAIKIFTEIDKDGVFTICPIKVNPDEDGANSYIYDFILTTKDATGLGDECVSIYELQQLIGKEISSADSGLKHIIFPYGGNDLDSECKKIYNEYESTGDIDTYKGCYWDLFKELSTVFLGLTILLKEGYAHCDIKELNIMYNKDADEGRKMKIIDFGFLRKTNELFKTDKVGCKDFSNYPLGNIMHESDYQYWPPDASINEGDTLFVLDMKGDKEQGGALEFSKRLVGNEPVPVDDNSTYWTYNKKNNGMGIGEKIDVYSLGVVIINLVRRYQGNFFKDLGIERVDFYKLVDGMKMADYDKRCNIEDAMTEYNKIFNPYGGVYGEAGQGAETKGDGPHSPANPSIRYVALSPKDRQETGKNAAAKFRKQVKDRKAV